MGSQSKQACYAKGGAVPKLPRVGGVMPAIKGQPMNPLTKVKMQNGIPGFKSGGKVKPACKC